MKHIKTVKELELDKQYWCRCKRFPDEVQLLTVKETHNTKYIGNHIWASEDNPQALDKYDIVGPAELPNMDTYI